MSDPKPSCKHEAATPPLRLQTAELFAGQREIVIVHQGQNYLLRITRNDKLILTK